MRLVNAARKRCDERKEVSREREEEKKKKKKKKLRYRDLSQFHWNANERQQRVIIRRKEDWRDTSGVTRIFDPKPARLSRRR